MSTARFPSGDPNALHPPHERGTIRAFGLAALFHLLLIALIAFGVHWKSHPPEAVEAELWSPTVQRAAPRPTAPMERKQPQPEPRPAPPPPPPTPVLEPKPQPQVQQADIVLRQEREAALKKQQEQQAQLEKRLRDEKKKLAEEKQRLAEQRAQQQQREQAQKLADKQREKAEKLQQEKLAQQKKLEAQQRLAEQKQKQQEQQQARLAASSRDDYMKHVLQQAGTGAATSTGTAAQTSGPSGTYAARIAGLVRENVTYPEINQITGDPRVTILVNLAQDGAVLTAKIEHSSGVPSWDQAVLRAIERVGRFPPDSNGKIWTPMLVKAGPRDPG